MADKIRCPHCGYRLEHRHDSQGITTKDQLPDENAPLRCPMCQVRIQSEKPHPVVLPDSTAITAEKPPSPSRPRPQAEPELEEGSGWLRAIGSVLVWTLGSVLALILLVFVACATVCTYENLRDGGAPAPNEDGLPADQPPEAIEE